MWNYLFVIMFLMLVMTDINPVCLQNYYARLMGMTTYLYLFEVFRPFKCRNPLVCFYVIEHLILAYKKNEAILLNT